MNKKTMNDADLKTAGTLLMELFSRYPKVTATEENAVAFLSVLQELTLPELRHAIEFWARNETGFPSTAGLYQLGMEKRRADATWTNNEEAVKMLEEQEAPQFLHRNPDFDDKPYRMQQLRRYDKLLQRYPDKENW